MPVKIGNKEYKTVAERLVEFHEEYKDKAINIMTEVIPSERNNHVRMKCVIEITEPLRIFTGHAEEDYDGNFINKTSALEVCETSCIGRALATAGKIGEELASAEEVANAIRNQGRGKRELLSPSTVEKAKDNISRSNLLSSSWSDTNRENPIKFGKHKGTKWSEVTDNYVTWLSESSDNKTVKQFATDEMDYRDSLKDSSIEKLKDFASKVAEKHSKNAPIDEESEKADKLIDAIVKGDESFGDKKSEELPF